MKAVFLDRDNTLIENEGDLGDPDDVRLRDGVGASLRRLREAGYRLVVVTNQGGVARGKYTEQDVDAVHQRIAELIDEQAEQSGVIDRFYYCPYHPDGTVDEYRREHPWRKPHPGMLLQAARDLELDLGESWMVGDQSRDVAAGVSAGCRTILLADREKEGTAAGASFTAKSIDDAARIILDPPSNGSITDATGGKRRVAVIKEKRAVVRRRRRRPSLEEPSKEFESLRRAVHDLVEEMRSERLRRTEFTLMRLAAGIAQLSAVLLAVLGLLQLDSFELFVRWLIAAMLAQLVTIAILLFDSRA